MSKHVVAGSSRVTSSKEPLRITPKRFFVWDSKYSHNFSFYNSNINSAILLKFNYDNGIISIIIISGCLISLIVKSNYRREI